MRKLQPQTRFLLRGSALVIGCLILWWFALLTPMLAALNVAGNVTGGIIFGSKGDLLRELPSGDWTFRVPLEKTIPAGPENPVPQQIHSIEFDIPRIDVIAFTFSLPVFWAVMLAAPDLRRNLTAMAAGTLVTIVIELVLLVVFAEVSAQKAAGQLAEGASFSPSWILRFGEYLCVSVIPHAAPFFIAVAAHRELRNLIFQWSTSSRQAVQGNSKDVPKKRRRP